LGARYLEEDWNFVNVYLGMWMNIYFYLLLVGLAISCSFKQDSRSKIKAFNDFSNFGHDTLNFKSGIRAILHDSKGNYWFGSDQEGVCKYDGKSFTYFTVKDGLLGKQVASIQEDVHGFIWLGTEQGICCYDGEKVITHPVKVSDSQWSLSSSDLWFSAGKNIDLVRVHDKKLHLITNPVQRQKNQSVHDLGATAFSKGKSGNLWIGCYPSVLAYDGIRVKEINDRTLGFDGEKNYLHVRSILEDSQGRLWIGNNGIGALLKEGDQFIHFSQKMKLVNGPVFSYPSPKGTMMHVFALAEDSQGNIWFGDRDNGAWKFDGLTVQNYTIDSSLKSQHIWAIYKDRKDNLLFGMADKGVYYYNNHIFTRVF
jgi:ligand-binding sensor domain-containing protein